MRKILVKKLLVNARSATPWPANAFKDPFYLRTFYAPTEVGEHLTAEPRDEDRLATGATP